MALFIVAAVVLGNVGYGFWAGRRSVGNTSLRAILASNRHDVTLGLVALVSTVAITVIVATPVAGMPAARPLALTGFVISVFSGVFAQFLGRSRSRDGRVKGHHPRGHVR